MSDLPTIETEDELREWWSTVRSECAAHGTNRPGLTVLRAAKVADAAIRASRERRAPEPSDKLEDPNITAGASADALERASESSDELRERERLELMAYTWGGGIKPTSSRPSGDWHRVCEALHMIPTATADNLVGVIEHHAQVASDVRAALVAYCPECEPGRIDLEGAWESFEDEVLNPLMERAEVAEADLKMWRRRTTRLEKHMADHVPEQYWMAPSSDGDAFTAGVADAPAVDRSVSWGNDYSGETQHEPGKTPDAPGVWRLRDPGWTDGDVVWIRAKVFADRLGLWVAQGPNKATMVTHENLTWGGRWVDEFESPPDGAEPCPSAAQTGPRWEREPTDGVWGDGIRIDHSNGQWTIMIHRPGDTIGRIRAAGLTDREMGDALRQLGWGATDSPTTEPELSDMGWSLHKLYSVARTRSETSDERYGQALFNTLVQVGPDIAKRLRASPDDPFYADVGDEKFERAIAVIESMWGGSYEERARQWCEEAKGFAGTVAELRAELDLTNRTLDDSCSRYASAKANLDALTAKIDELRAWLTRPDHASGAGDRVMIGWGRCAKFVDNELRLALLDTANLAGNTRSPLNGDTDAT